jgi:flagellar basal-body rod protein FlgG
MFRSLYVAATGMVAQETKLDTIANNLANANTVGYKRQEAEFEDLVYQSLRAPALGQGGAVSPASVEIGSGSRVVSTPRLVSQGAVEQTNNPLDVAIEGSGYFPVLRADGGVAYTRAGALKLDATGRLVTSEGFSLEPPITVPPDATSVSIGRDGVVAALQPGQAAPTPIGTIQLASFANPAGLRSLGHNLFEASDASGQAEVGSPGAAGRGSLLQGALESSNVEVVNEMIGLIRTQRAYEINSKVISAADEMLRNATQLR